MSNENQGQIIAQYRKAKNWSQEDLAGALRVDPRTVQRMEKQSMIKDIGRRRLIVGLLSIPAVMLGLETEQQLPQQAPIAVNQDRMTFFEDEMATRWDMYHTGGTVRAARGLDMWLSEMLRFAKSSDSTIWHDRALTLLTMSYQLHNCVMRDLLQFDQAHISFKKAYQVAKELDDTEMIGATLAREGITYIQQDQPEKAIKLLTGALEITKHDRLPLLRGYTLQALSEAYAKAQRHQECWQSVGFAERILERQDRVQERSLVQFIATTLTAQKGVDAVLLRDNDRAIALIDKSLINYDPTWIRGGASLIAQKAEAYQGLGFIDASVDTAEEALKLSHSVGSNKTFTRIHKLHGLLSASAGKEPSVARLGALLVEYQR